MAADRDPPPEDRIGDRRRCLQEFELYETRSNFYLIGMDEEGGSRRVLKIDRSEPSELKFYEDDATYTAKECGELLKRIHEGNKSTGGLKFVTNCYGIVGFAKFLGPYYMLLITKRRPIGVICGHTIYTITESRIITISNSRTLRSMNDLWNENRYKKLLCMVDLTKDFFFSYSFHVMHSLQKSFSESQERGPAYETMFVWNEFLTRGIRSHLQNTLWTVALVYGFFKQANLRIKDTGKDFKLTLIARRSRHYAGTRFLKRGVNEMGSVANDVETEQIVFEDIPEGIPSQISSVVQYRGSIPLFWSQETSRLNLKPDIVLQDNDQNYEATRLHFENLVERYGNPIIILNLIKTHERKPRESKLWAKFVAAIEHINKHLSEEDYLRFLHWDLSTYSKREATGALTFLGKVASCALESTRFFYCQLTQDLTLGNGLCPPIRREFGKECVMQSKQSIDNHSNDDEYRSDSSMKSTMLQRGVLRTNCIDCLDRTNVAQYAYGLAALGSQLHKLGLIDESKIDLDDPLADELMNFYETMGDTLALQYTGSAAHNKIFSERRGHWKAAIQSQEFLRTLQRYYSNAYMDAEKQAAINVFLGQRQPQEDEYVAWDTGSERHCNARIQANGLTDEFSRTFGRRSFSDGNFIGAYKMQSGTILKKRMNSEILGGVTQGGTYSGLSSSPTEICACDSNISPRKYGTTSSNFLDVGWLSASENSWEEETNKSLPLIGSSAQGSAENVSDASTGEVVSQQSDSLNLQDGKLAKVEGCDDVGNISEHFMHWVINGGTFYH